MINLKSYLRIESYENPHNLPNHKACLYQHQTGDKYFYLRSRQRTTHFNIYAVFYRMLISTLAFLKKKQQK